MAGGRGSDGSVALLASASVFFRVPLTSPGFVADFFRSAGCALSSPLAVRLVDRPAGPVSIDLR